MNHTNEISIEQYEAWAKFHKELLASMRLRPALDRERSMLYAIESILLRVRLSIGLGDPGSNEKPQTPQEENLDPDGVRESD
jgi:hypothetical protein